MVNLLNLEKLERLAWRSTFEDGLWDIYLGWLLIGLSAPIVLTELGVGRGWGYFISLLMMGAGMVAMWLGKRYITIPRLGKVTFSAKRQNRKGKLRWFIGGIVVLTIVLWLTFSSWSPPGSFTAFSWRWLAPLIWVVVVGATFAGIALQFDHERFFLIGFLYAASVPVDEWLTAVTGLDLTWLAFGLPGLTILAMGSFHLWRFIRSYPRSSDSVVTSSG